MATIKDLREGILTRLKDISGLRPVSHAPDRVSVPAAAIELSSLQFGATFGPNAVDVYEFTVRVYASRADDKAGQDRLDTFINADGDTSVYQALNGDTTLGGVAQTLRVTGLDNYGVYEVGATAYYGAEFAVTVWARRS
jgi:hypothetical protein